MKLLVTGASGFIGSNLCLQLEANGHNVTAVVHNKNTISNLDGFSGQVTEHDVSEPTYWQSLDGNFDAVLHQAACTDTTVYDEDFMMRQNLGTFTRLLKWAEHTGTDIIYASSAATYGSASAPQTVGKNEGAINIYGESKLKQDELTRSKLDSTPIKIIGLRYFNVYGPREAHKGKMASMIYQLAQQIKAGKNPRIFTDGNQMRDQIYVGDIVQANLCALKADKNKSGIYNAGTGNAVSFNLIIQELNRVMGTNLLPEYVENPYGGKYQEHTQADITEANAKLGFKPKFSLRSGIQTYYDSGLLV